MPNDCRYCQNCKVKKIEVVKVYCPHMGFQVSPLTLKHNIARFEEYYHNCGSFIPLFSEKEINQTEIAKKAGVSVGFVNHVFTGISRPSEKVENAIYQLGLGKDLAKTLHYNYEQSRVL